jgi:hypothetical protein
MNTERKGNVFLKYYVSFLFAQLQSWLNIIDNLSFLYTFFATVLIIGERANEVY